MINPSKYEVLSILIFMVTASTCALCLALTSDNVPWRVRRGYFLKLIFLWMGISLGLTHILQDISDEKRLTPLPKDFHKEWRLFPSGVILPRNSSLLGYERFKHLDYSDQPVIFITPTEYSTVQAALLTRLGQALFPMRHIIKWIIVQPPLDASPFNDDLVGKRDGQFITFEDAVNNSREELTRLQMRHLDKLVSRFGIPYKLLSSDEEYSVFKTSWAGFDLDDRVPDQIAKAYLIGLLWALKSLAGGVIVLGDEQYVYNSALFWELRKTRIASCWPVAFESGNVSISFPIAETIHVSEERKEHNILQFVVDHDHLEAVRIQRSGFAIDAGYLRKSVPYKDYWKLTFDSSLTNMDFSIQLQEIQVMGSGGSEIYVWKFATEEQEWPRKIKVRKRFYTGTNVNSLLETSFGIRIKIMEELIHRTDNFTVYEEYDMSKHAKGFL